MAESGNQRWLRKRALSGLSAGTLLSLAVKKLVRGGEAEAVEPLSPSEARRVYPPEPNADHMRPVADVSQPEVERKKQDHEHPLRTHDERARDPWQGRNRETPEREGEHEHSVIHPATPMECRPIRTCGNIVIARMRSRRSPRINPRSYSIDPEGTRPRVNISWARSSRGTFSI